MEYSAKRRHFTKENPMHVRRLSLGYETAIAIFAAIPCVIGTAGEGVGRGRIDAQVDSRGQIHVSHDGQVIVSYEALQLIDRSKGWRTVFSYGTAKATRLDKEAGGLKLEESAPNILSYTKEVRVGESEIAWELKYAVSGDAGATDNYYFIDIPEAALSGSFYSARTAHGRTYGNMDAARLSGLASVTFLSAKRKIEFELGGENVTWLLTDWTASQHKSYRLRIENRLEGRPFEAKVQVRLRVKAGSAAEVEAARRQAIEAQAARLRARLAARGFVNDKPLHLGPLTANAPRVGQREKFELTFEAAGRYRNPFDPEQIDVSAEFVSRSGKRTLMPAFLYQEFRRGAAGIKRTGAPVWKVRFAPLEVGDYTYRVTAENRGERAASAKGSFTCTGREARGYVRVSKANPLYYEFDSGEPYFPSGINLFFGTHLGRPLPEDRLEWCERWMSRLADHEGNFVRLRMDSWWIAIEMTPDDEIGYLGLGYYHQRSCWEIDRLYDVAAARGIYVMHCLDNANSTVNDPKQSWRLPYNLYLKSNRGVCDTAEEFWGSPQARRYVRNKLRYCVARWGWRPNLMCWEFWNEMACRAKTIEAATVWHQDMARHLRSLDPYGHPITTSLAGDKTLADKIWALPEMEIVQYHNYQGADTAPVIVQLTLDPVQRHHKPFFLGEYGVGPRYAGRSAAFDKAGVQIHNGMWAAAFAGGSGAGALWYVKSFLDEKNLYFHYRGLARFAKRVPWNDPKLRRWELEAPTLAARPEQEHYVDLKIPTSHKYAFKRPPQTEFTINSDGTVLNSEMIRGMLHCGKDRKAPPTFHVDAKQPVQFVVTVSRSVGDESNKLLVHVDGELVREEPFPASKEADAKSTYVKEYDNWRTPYEKSVSVDLSPGRHTVRPEAVGKDRLEVQYTLKRGISFERTRPLRAYGLRTDASGYLWLQNRSSTWWTEYEGKKPIPLSGMALKARGLPDGVYRLEWWDTWAANAASEAEAKSVGGVLTLAIPEVTRDVACAIEPR